MMMNRFNIPLQIPGNFTTVRRIKVVKSLTFLRLSKIGINLGVKHSQNIVDKGKSS